MLRALSAMTRSCAEPRWLGPNRKAGLGWVGLNPDELGKVRLRRARLGRTEMG